MDMDTLLYVTWRTRKDLLDSTGDSAHYSVMTLWFPGGRMGDTLLYLTCRTSKDLLDSTGDSAQCGWRGVWGRRGTCVCMAESLCCPSETIPTSLIDYTQGMNPGLPHCRQFLYPMTNKGSPTIPPYKIKYSKGKTTSRTTHPVRLGSQPGGASGLSVMN